MLNRELLTKVGDIDLYARDQQGRYVVVALKRARATQDAVHQLHRCVHAVARFLSFPVRGILDAPARTQLQALGLEFAEVQALPVARDEAAQGALS